MGLQPNWKPEEVEKLKSCLEQKYSYKKIADTLGRSYNAVYKKVDRLNLRDEATIPRRHPWSDEEIEKLTELVQEFPYKAFVLQYNRWAKANGYPRRTAANLSGRLSVMKNASRRLDSPFYLSVTQLQEALGSTRWDIYDWIERYKKELNPISKTGKEKGMFVFSCKKLRKFFIKYPAILEKYRSSVDIGWLVDLLGNNAKG